MRKRKNTYLKTSGFQSNSLLSDNKEASERVHCALSFFVLLYSDGIEGKLNKKFRNFIDKKITGIKMILCICTRYMHTINQRGDSMARTTKCRQVCCVPTCLRFTPEGEEPEYLELTVEELESIRLCDLESFDQDVASSSMNISRGTLQRILYSARKKVAEALCSGKGIFINGGNYETVNHLCRGRLGCKRHCHTGEAENEEM